MGALAHEVKFKRDAKKSSDGFKKNKKDIFKDVTRGGPWVSPFMEQNLNRTQKHEAFTA